MRPSRWSPALFAVVLATSCWASHARAQALTPQEEANARFQAGLKYYDARDFESARLAFTQAYAVMQKPGILLNLGLSEVYGNHPVEGLEHLEQFLKDGSLPADKKERAKRGVDDAYKKTGHLAIRTSREAEVKVDARTLSPGQTLVHVLPGPRRVEAKLGEKTKTADVDAAAGVTTNVELAFEGAPVAPVVGAPSASTSKPEEPHTEPPPVSPTEGSFWGWQSVGGLVLIGSAGVALGLHLSAVSTENEQKDRIPGLRAPIPSQGCKTPSAQCAELYDAIQKRNDASAQAGRALAISIASLGVGAALLVTAAVWKHRHTGLNIVPSAGPREAGLVLFSTF